MLPRLQPPPQHQRPLRRPAAGQTGGFHLLLTPIERRRGLPIGNLTSQFFANVYLNPLNHFVKERLRVRGYLRYVDDFALFHGDPGQLAAWREEIGHL